MRTPRALTLLEQDRPPRTLTVDPEYWQLNQTKRAKHLRFGAEAAGLTLHGALHLGKEGRVGGYLKLREGEWQKSYYALTARSTASGPAGLFYIHTDHLGTAQILTDETQHVVWAADYQPFGETTLTKDNVSFNLRFPGQYFDAETGLHYNYFRDYDPATGRYIQPDPIGLAGGLNNYAYVGGNTLKRTDPFGLEPVQDMLDKIREDVLKDPGDLLKDKLTDGVRDHMNDLLNPLTPGNIGELYGILCAGRKCSVAPMAPYLPEGAYADCYFKIPPWILRHPSIRNEVYFECAKAAQEYGNNCTTTNR